MLNAVINKKIDKTVNKTVNFFILKDFSKKEKFILFISRLLSINKATKIKKNKNIVFLKADRSLSHQ